jgi:hypothetical protein
LLISRLIASYENRVAPPTLIALPSIIRAMIAHATAHPNYGWTT